MDVGNVNDRWIWRGVKPNDTTQSGFNFTQPTPSLPTATTHLDLNLKWTSSQLNDHVTSQTKTDHLDHITDMPSTPWLWDYGSTLASLFNFPEPNIKVDQLKTNTSEAGFSRWSWRMNQTLNTGENTDSNLYFPPTTFKTNSTEWAETSVDFVKELDPILHNGTEPPSLSSTVTSINHSSFFHPVLTLTPYFTTKNHGNYSPFNSSVEMTAIHDGLLYHILSRAVVSILAILLFVSIVANSLILVTILCRNNLRKTFFFLYLSLAASDLMASAFTVPIVILCVLQPDTLPFEACALMTTAVVLTMYVSVGSIASLCVVRWWQFYNFSKIRTREKIAIQFIILVLWITGFGITSGFVSQDTKMDTTCTLDYIAAIFHNMLPFTSVSVSAGLFVIALVNYLTIKKIQKKFIYSRHRKGSKSSLCTHVNQIIDQTAKSHSVQANFSFDVNIPGEFNQNIPNGTPREKDIFSCDTNLPIYKNAPIPKVVTINETTRNRCLEPGSSNSHTQDIPTPEKMSTTCETQGPDQMIQLPLHGEGTSGAQREICPSNDLHLDKHLVPATTLTNSYEKKGTDKKCIFKNPQNDMQEFKCCESDVDSEHIYEMIEPLDVQEHIPQNTKANYHEKLPAGAISLPNTVDTFYSTNPVIKRHQTTIVNVASAPPDDHVVNVLAWINNSCDFRLSLPVKNDKNILNKKTFTNTTQPMNYEETIIQDPLPLLKAPLNFTNPRVQKATTADIFTSVSSKNIWGSVFDQLQQSPTRKNFFPLMDTEDSLCAGYMADLSAHSSKHSTPQQKLSRKQRVERITALATARKISGLAAAIDSEDESPKFVSAITPKARRSYHYQSSSYPHVGSRSNLELGMHPVRQKCVQISCRLVAFFAVAYLPLLALQIAVFVAMNSSVLFLMITYKVLLLAIHPSFYGFQSSILLSEVRKMAKISIFSIPQNTVQHLRTPSLIPQHYDPNIQLRPSSHPQWSKRPASFTNSKIRPWSHPV